MSGWVSDALARAAFLLSHAVPVRPTVKARLVARIGARGFALAYSTVSVLALAMLIVALGRARRTRCPSAADATTGPTPRKPDSSAWSATPFWSRWCSGRRGICRPTAIWPMR